MNYVLLNQGTPESKAAAVYLNRLLEDGDEIHSLFLDFGLPNRDAALLAAQRIAEEFCTTHGVMFAQMIVDGIDVTPLYFDKYSTEYISAAFVSDEAKHGDTLTRLIQYPYYIPKTIMECFAYARTVAKAAKVVMVHGRNDPKWYADMAKLFNEPPPPNQPYEPIELLLPFHGMDLRDTLESLGLTAADVADTVFCAESPPCGNCTRCMKKEELFDADDTTAT